MLLVRSDRDGGSVEGEGWEAARVARACAYARRVRTGPRTEATLGWSDAADGAHASSVLAAGRAKSPSLDALLAAARAVSGESTIGAHSLGDSRLQPFASESLLDYFAAADAVKVA